MLKPKLTNRRDFIRLSAMGAASAAILAACAPAATPTAAPAAKPTEAPKPAATTAAAKPTEAPKPAATTAAPKPAEAAKPTAASAAKPTMKVPTFPLTLGFVGPITGELKTFGESTKNGFEMAVAEANAAGAKITTKIADDKADPTESANAVTKFITQDKVHALVGSVTSKATIADAEIANANKIPLISPTATNPQVTVVDGKRKEYVFRACYLDDFQGAAIAKLALETVKAKKAAVMFDVSNDYTKGLAEYFRDAFKKGGGEVAVFESYGEKDVDFSAILTKVAAANPDVLVLTDYYNKVSLIAKQAREKGIKATMVGGDGWDSAELDFKVTDGSYFTNHYSPDEQRPEVQDWVTKYREKHKGIPDALATLAYDATKVLIAAAAEAGAADPAKIREALQNTKDYPGVSGKITFDQNGNPVKDLAVIKIENAKPKFVSWLRP